MSLPRDPSFSSTYALVSASFSPKLDDKICGLTERYNGCFAETKSTIRADSQSISILDHWVQSSANDFDPTIYKACLNFLGLESFSSVKQLNLQKQFIFLHLQSLGTGPDYLSLLKILLFAEKYIPVYSEKKSIQDAFEERLRLKAEKEMAEEKKEALTFRNQTSREEIDFIKSLVGHYGNKEITNLSPSLILKKMSFTDPLGSGKEFVLISSLHYAVWAGNIFLLKQLLSHLTEESDKVEALKQLYNVMTEFPKVVGLPSDFEDDMTECDLAPEKSPLNIRDITSTVARKGIFDVLPYCIAYDFYSEMFRRRKSTETVAYLFARVEQSFHPEDGLFYYESLNQYCGDSQYSNPQKRKTHFLHQVDEVQCALEQQIIQMQLPVEQKHTKCCVIS